MTSGKTLPSLSQEVAVSWQGREGETFSVSFATMWEWVSRFASVLEKYEMSRGEMLCIYLPQVPERIAAVLGASAKGVIPFFCRDAQEMQKLVLMTKAKIAFTTDELLPAFANLDLEKVIVLKRGAALFPLNRERDVWFHEVMAKAKGSPINLELEGKIGHPGL